MGIRSSGGSVNFHVFRSLSCCNSIWTDFSHSGHSDDLHASVKDCGSSDAKLARSRIAPITSLGEKTADSSSRSFLANAVNSRDDHMLEAGHPTVDN